MKRPLRLYEIVGPQLSIAVTRHRDPDSCDLVFCLDFSRPLELRRWLLRQNGRLGWVCRLRVPVIHRDETLGTRYIDVGRSDPAFHDLRELWDAYFPRRTPRPPRSSDAGRIDADFAAHFANS